MKVPLVLVLAAAAGACPAQFAKFECQAHGSTFPALGAAGDCEGLTAEPGLPDGKAEVLATSECVVAVPDCFPTQGARYARLQAGPALVHALGSPAVRPLPPGITELRIPIPAQSPVVRFAWAWFNEEGWPTVGDGFDFSVCDAAGVRVLQCAFGDTTTIPGWGYSGRRLFAAPLPAGGASSGWYLSCAVFDGANPFNGWNYLFIDDVQFTTERPGFEPQAVGPFPPFGAVPDVEGVTGHMVPGALGYAGVEAAPFCAMPVDGAHFALISSGAKIDVAAGVMVPRPLAAGVSEMRVPIPCAPPETTTAFDWRFDLEDGPPFNDGFDVSICDAAGYRLAVCVRGDSYGYPFGCSAPQRWFGTFAGLPAGAYLSFACFNGGDTQVASSLLVDAISFADRPRMTWSSPPGGAGGLALLIDDGKPNDVCFAPIVLQAGAYPVGWFYGVDIALTDLLIEINLGPPFLGWLDGRGRFAYGPLFGLSGLQVWSVAMDDLTAPVGPRAGYPAHYAVP